MSTTEALILGAIQGLTEFLPISSSGHLALANHLLGMKDLESNLVFTLILHLASLAAVFLYYRARIAALVSSAGRRELAYLLLATIPIFAVGALFGKKIEDAQGVPLLICACFVVNGLFLFVADRYSRGDQKIADAPWWKIGVIGLAQAARLPGLSRSGGTIGTGWLCGIERGEAVRFSFLLSIPAILGACAWKARKLDLGQVDLPLGPILLGAGVTFGLSLVSIRVVEKLSARNRFLVFSVYGVAAGLAAAAWFLTRGR
ncbi:MAG TPA: undecaprenyl-diphosphate phosphatase [Planctomycetota bacterium]|nr:undecaprenyl-diphosphate phosphatase [Planctomycetota bacterium]